MDAEDEDYYNFYSLECIGELYRATGNSVSAVVNR